MAKYEVLFFNEKMISTIFAQLFLIEKKRKHHINGPVAQWIEQQPSKLWVTRSSRVGVTYYTFRAVRFFLGEKFLF
jgi:hypothetical protein